MYKLTYTPQNARQARAGVRRRKNLIHNLAPVFRTLHAPIRAHFRKNFNTGGAHGGPAWADFSGEPKYRAMKLAITDNAKPLVWGKFSQSRLMPSLTQASHPDHLYGVARDGMLVGTTVPYANRLARGGIGPFGERFPGRNPVQIQQRQWHEFAQMILKALIKRATTTRSDQQASP